MKLLPFVLTAKQTEKFTIYTLSLFLSHAGKSLWDVPGSLSKATIQSEYCEENGLYPTFVNIDNSNQVAYIHIDTKKTNLSDFYTWEEALQKGGKPECWRKFYFIQDSQGAFWWSPKGLIEAEIQEGGNVQDIFEEVLRRSKDTLPNLYI